MEDNEYWRYAFNTSLNPTDILQIEQLQKQGLSGKWLVFVPAHQLEDAWKQVKTATIEGRLGQSSKVARQIRPNQDPLMCIYTKNWSDHGDLTRVLIELRHLGFTSHLSYKEDIATYLGLYQGTAKYPASMYVATTGATTFTQRRPDAATIHGVKPADIIALGEDEGVTTSRQA